VARGVLAPGLTKFTVTAVTDNSHKKI